MTEPKLFTISSLLMAFLFAYSASVQLNDPGNYLGCKTISGITRNAEEAESLAILEAVLWAREKGKAKVCLISDAKLVLDYLNNNNNQICWFNNSILDDCKSVISSFSFIRFEFLNRSFTSMADTAAKYCRISRGNGEWFGYTPNFLTTKM
ncbi:uncharacterized protein LOC113330418 isoform X2 [Papaver somniferum]|uniref:uncharacterized protein LOC113330418 isoform X2 n=1 Tax=Papaver somniferum TaxID=3469 RepID=UPI000E703C53|nr:uncharacterized protein LOC113330418 isoform X2 [Papaver somniferum]